MMQGTGVDVSYETEGKAAVETVVQAQEKNEGFHVILLDWKMPGQDGVETVRQIRKRVRENIPVLVMTAYDWSEIEDEARAAGADAFMPKPFFVSTFRQTLESLYADREKEELAPDIGDILKGLRFLVAEDNELNAEILSELMDMEGAQCELAVNGQEAVEMFLRSEPEYYDLILMDVQMPVMNGYEATRMIRACGHPRAESIPIVAMTANAFAEDVQNALDAGMNGHLSKPNMKRPARNVCGLGKRMSKPGHGSLVCSRMMHGGEISFQPHDQSSTIPPENTVETTLSLASGTFVLLVRLFFCLRRWRCRLPDSERRTANENRVQIRHWHSRGGGPR